jgi:hypothetical protein
MLAALLLLPLLPLASAADSSVTGRVTDPQGKAVPQAKLRLAYGSTKPVESISDADGRFTFTGLTEGSYRLSAMGTGFAEVKKTLHLSSGQDLAMDVQFSRLGPAPIRLS